MPLNFKTGASTSKAAPRTSSAVPKGMASIHSLQPGAGFSFTSSKKKENSGPYIKMKSTKNPGAAFNLTTFKQVNFDKSENGVPQDLEISAK